MDSNNVGLILSQPSLPITGRAGSSVLVKHRADSPVSLRLNQIWNSPGFVERHPYHNTRVADIPLNHLSPL